MPAPVTAASQARPGTWPPGCWLVRYRRQCRLTVRCPPPSERDQGADVPFRRAADAHHTSLGGRVCGKLVLDPLTAVTAAGSPGSSKVTTGPGPGP